MLAQHAQRSLERAAAETLDRIRSDQERVSGRLRPLLEHIEVHLFDPGLDVNQLKRRCGVRDNSVPIQFHSQLGKPPHAYIEKCRLETACRLLVDTELKVWQIANLLGYSSIQVFSRAFTRWADIRPTAFRRRERRKAAERPEHQQAVVVAAPKAETRLGVDTLKAALDGELEASQADRLIRRLLNLYPATGLMLDRPALVQATAAATETSQPALADAPFRTVPLPAPPGPDYRRLLTLEEIETARAEALWEQIKDLPQDEQRAAIRGGARFETEALFEVVKTASIQLGRSNREQGVLAANLLHVVADEHPLVHCCHTDIKARAWVWVGNAHRLALDFGAAEDCFVEAEDRIRSSGDEYIHGELFSARSFLYLYQRRHDEAVDAATDAIECFERGGFDQMVGRALLKRALLFGQQNRISESSSDLEAAMPMIRRDPEPSFMASAISLLARNYLKLERFEDALEAVAEAKTSPGFAEDSEAQIKIAWIEANIADEGGHATSAQELYRKAFDLCVASGRVFESARLSLDWASFHWKHGRLEQVIAITSEMLPIFDKLRAHEDAYAAFSLLVEATKKQRLSKKIFKEVERELLKAAPSSR